MTVAELIEALKALPPDLLVGYTCDDWCEVSNVSVQTGKLHDMSGWVWFREGTRDGSDQAVNIG